MPQRQGRAPRERCNGVRAVVHVTLADRSAEGRHELGAVAQVVVVGRAVDERGNEVLVVERAGPHVPPTDLRIQSREIGGQIGAHYGRRLHPAALRGVIVVVGGTSILRLIAT